MMKKNSVGSAKKTKSVKQAVAAVNANFKEEKKNKKLEKKAAKRDMKLAYTKALRKESPERALSIIAVLLTFVSVILQVFFIDKGDKVK